VFIVYALFGFIYIHDAFKVAEKRKIMWSNTRNGLLVQKKVIKYVLIVDIRYIPKSNVEIRFS